MRVYAFSFYKIQIFVMQNIFFKTFFNEDYTILVPFFFWLLIFLIFLGQKSGKDIFFKIVYRFITSFLCVIFSLVSGSLPIVKDLKHNHWFDKNFFALDLYMLSTYNRWLEFTCYAPSIELQIITYQILSVITSSIWILWLHHVLFGKNLRQKKIKKRLILLSEFYVRMEPCTIGILRYFLIAWWFFLNLRKINYFGWAVEKGFHIIMILIMMWGGMHLVCYMCYWYENNNMFFFISHLFAWIITPFWIWFCRYLLRGYPHKLKAPVEMLILASFCRRSSVWLNPFSKKLSAVMDSISRQVLQLSNNLTKLLQKKISWTIFTLWFNTFIIFQLTYIWFFIFSILFVG